MTPNNQLVAINGAISVLRVAGYTLNNDAYMALIKEKAILEKEIMNIAIQDTIDLKSWSKDKPSDFRAFQKPIEDYRNNPDYESRNNPDDYIKELHNDRITDWDLYPDSEAMSYPSSKWPREIFMND